jgi:hypothetical protein
MYLLHHSHTHRGHLIATMTGKRQHQNLTAITIGTRNNKHGCNMTSKKINKAHRQIGDQTTKGGLLGIMIYTLSKNNVDPVLIAMITPVAASLLAWVSTKIGDPDLACLFIPDEKNGD